MQSSDFEGPPLHWSILSIVGAIFTAALLIVGLEVGANRFQLVIPNNSKSSQAATPEPVVIPESVNR